MGQTLLLAELPSGVSAAFWPLLCSTLVVVVLVVRLSGIVGSAADTFYSAHLRGGRLYRTLATARGARAIHAATGAAELPTNHYLLTDVLS